MIELSNIEIDEVSGGMGALQLFIYIGNAILEFGTGWVDGVNAAYGN